jgi:drug/metabolite transporter (DMT)-like permease
MGFTVYSGNFFYLLGVSTAGSVTASIWQPSQPVITLVFAALLGTEKLTMRRLLGICVATVGCFIMVLVHPSSAVDSDGTTAAPDPVRTLGNVFFLVRAHRLP